MQKALFAAWLFAGAFGPSSASAQSSVDWLQKDMSCDQLTSEMKTRYSNLGSYAQLSDDKKMEIGVVLEILCGARFAHCNFKNCAKLAPAKQDGGNKATPTPTALPVVPVNYEAEARKLLDERFNQQAAELRQKIDQLREKEKAENRAWMKISVLDEKVVEEEPAADDVELPAAVPDVKKVPVVKEPTRTSARGKLDLQAALPATPDIETPVPQGMTGKATGKFLPKSSAGFHHPRTGSSTLSFAQTKQYKMPAF